MGKKEEKSCFVYTCRLFIEPWQEHILFKQMECADSVYNYARYFAFQRLNELTATEECQSLMEKIYNGEDKDFAATNALRQSIRDYKYPLKQKVKKDEKINKYTYFAFKEYKDFSNLVSYFKATKDCPFIDVFSSVFIAKNVIKPLSVAFDKCINGIKKKNINKDEKTNKFFLHLNIKRKSEENGNGTQSLRFEKQSSNGKPSGIETFLLYDLQPSKWGKLYQKNYNKIIEAKRAFGRNILFYKVDDFFYNDKRRSNKKASIKERIFPICFKPEQNKNGIKEYDESVVEKLYEEGSIKVLTITFCPRKNKNIWQIRFTFDGISPVQSNIIAKQTEGKVGIDIGTSTVAVCGDNNSWSEPLGGYSEEYEEIKRRNIRAQQKMDNIRRKDNPMNYAENGVVIKGLRKLYPYKKKIWYFSKEYKKWQQKHRSYERSLSIIKKDRNRSLANKIKSMGTEYIVENNDFKSLAKRAAISKTPNGKKKRYGRSILKYAPGQITTLLGIDKKKMIDVGKLGKDGPCASQYNLFTGEKEKHTLNERVFELIKGDKRTLVQRDMLAAFNLKYAKNDGNKYFYDTEEMKRAFPSFKANCDDHMNNLYTRLMNGKERFPDKGCMGITEYKKSLERS